MSVRGDTAEELGAEVRTGLAAAAAEAVGMGLFSCLVSPPTIVVVVVGAADPVVVVLVVVVAAVATVGDDGRSRTR